MIQNVPFVTMRLQHSDDLIDRSTEPHGEKKHEIEAYMCHAGQVEFAGVGKPKGSMNRG